VNGNRHSLLGPTRLCRPDWCSGGVCVAATVSVRPLCYVNYKKVFSSPFQRMYFKFLLWCLHIMCPPQKLLKQNLSFRFRCKNDIYWSIREPVIATKFIFLCFSLNLQTSFDVHVTVHCVKFLIIKPTRCTNYSNLFLEWNSTCFGQFLCPPLGVFHCTHSNICHTCMLTAWGLNQDGTPCSIQLWYISYRFADSWRAGSGWNPMFHPDPARKLSANLYDIYHCYTYSGKLLMLDRGTVRNV
jgi:hypothetical protein